MLLRFENQHAARLSEKNPAIKAKITEIKTLTGGPSQVVEAIGLGMWVDHVQGEEPKLPAFWKRVTISVLGVYPMLMVLLALLNPLLSGLPQPLQVFCLVVVLAILLTWPIMPTLGKLLHTWLARG